jgi:p-cumate 2,3-dioxygenase beta subunit
MAPPHDAGRTGMNRVSRSDVEEFVFAEADLLDEWRLPEWFELFTPDGCYYVPSTDVAHDAAPSDSLFYVADDHYRLGQRVKRLMKRTAHAEYPHSKTRHSITNVRIREQHGEELRASTAFITYRTNHGRTDVYVGTAYYHLLAAAEGLRIREKRAVLASEGLREQGRLSIIL